MDTCRLPDLLLTEGWLVQSTLRSPSIPKMKKATWGAYAFIMGVFFPMAITGYWAFGNGVLCLPGSHADDVDRSCVGSRPCIWS